MFHYPSLYYNPALYYCYFWPSINYQNKIYKLHYTIGSIIAISNRESAVIMIIYKHNNRRIEYNMFPAHNTLRYRCFYAIG